MVWEGCHLGVIWCRWCGLCGTREGHLGKERGQPRVYHTPPTAAGTPSVLPPGRRGPETGEYRERRRSDGGEGRTSCGGRVRRPVVAPARGVFSSHQSATIFSVLFKQYEGTGREAGVRNPTKREEICIGPGRRGGVLWAGGEPCRVASRAVFHARNRPPAFSILEYLYKAGSPDPRCIHRTITMHGDDGGDAGYYEDWGRPLAAPFPCAAS